MCFVERNTDRRGRSLSPATRLRMDFLRLSRASILVEAMFFHRPWAPLSACAGLADLTTQLLFEVLDALALIRLGRPHAANLRHQLADDFLVVAIDRQKHGVLARVHGALGLFCLGLH